MPDMPCHDCWQPVRRPSSNSQSGFRNDLPNTVQVHCSPWLVAWAGLSRDAEMPTPTLHTSRVCNQESIIPA